MNNVVLGALEKQARIQRTKRVVRRGCERAHTHTLTLYALECALVVPTLLQLLPFGVVVSTAGQSSDC
jgi:hypothetical protein